MVECVRASLKALVLHLSKERVLLNGGQVHKPVVTVNGNPEDSVEGLLGSLQGQPQPGLLHTAPTVVPALDNHPTRWARGARTGVCMPIPSTFPPYEKLKDDLDAKSKPVWLSAEILNIARPLVYLLARCVYVCVRVFGA